VGDSKKHQQRLSFTEHQSALASVCADCNLCPGLRWQEDTLSTLVTRARWELLALGAASAPEPPSKKKAPAHGETFPWRVPPRRLTAMLAKREDRLNPPIVRWLLGAEANQGQVAPIFEAHGIPAGRRRGWSEPGDFRSQRNRLVNT